MDDRLIGYALGLLEPADRDAVAAHLAAHPGDAAKVERVRRALRPLEADRDGYDPPPGLVAATLARTAEYLAARGLAVPTPPVEVAEPRPTRRPPADEPVFSSGAWRRADLIVAAGIGFIAFGLLMAGIGKLRQESSVRACQDQLRQLHVALAGYSDTHNGRFPQVGTARVPVAGAFAAELARAGQYPADQVPLCPAAPAPEPRVITTPAGTPLPAVGYSYALGYVGPGGSVVGLRRGEGADGVSEWEPIAADLPPVVPASATAHPRGQNVLFVGGAVRFTTTPAVGINGDYIYSNDAGLVRAGLYREDASLGRPSDRP
jgi:anti-sigma factor RsiW